MHLEIQLQIIKLIHLFNVNFNEIAQKYSDIQMSSSILMRLSVKPGLYSQTDMDADICGHRGRLLVLFSFWSTLGGRLQHMRSTSASSGDEIHMVK